jgi:hypothetical protein
MAVNGSAHDHAQWNGADDGVASNFWSRPPASQVTSGDRGHGCPPVKGLAKHLSDIRAVFAIFRLALYAVLNVVAGHPLPLTLRMNRAIGP